VDSVAAFVRSESPWIVSGLLTGPLFGWLGQRWRAHVAWLGALATTAALCLEPLARIPAGRAIRFREVWMAEVAFGVALAIFFVAAVIAIRDRGRRDPTPD
jgi:hypothetical protein